MFLRVLRIVLYGGQLIVLLVGLMLLLGYFWVGRTFEHATIDIMFLYLSLPLTGVDKQFIFDFISYVVLATLVLFLIFVRLRHTVAAGKVSWMSIRNLNVLILMFSLGVFSLSACMWETKYDVYSYLFPDTDFYTYFEERTEIVDAQDIVIDGNHRNLILITLESVDSVMTDGVTFSPPVMSALRALQQENQAFYGHRQAYGSIGSITSFSSVMTGVPFVFERRGWNDPRAEDDPDFFTVADMPETHPMQSKSMPGILERHGYRVQVILGAKIEFAGLDILMRLACKNVDFFDHAFFEKTRNDTAGRTNNWGLYDSYLYERSKEILTETASEGRPFAHLIQTVNTHVPGFYEPAMDRKYGDIRDTYRQGDAMLAEYVAWVRSQPFAENTTIVIMGDHLAPQKEIGGIPLPPRNERGVVVVFLNSMKTDAARGYQRLFGTWDVAPSILEAVGCRLPKGRLGLGTSLFSDKETLFEREGIPEYEKMIRKRSRLYNSLYRWF